MSNDSKQERISKLLAARGICSRREAERLIDAGLVEVDGVIVREQGVKAGPEAAIRVLAEAEEALGARLTVLLHKPVGVVSAQPEPDQTPAWKLLTARRAASVPAAMVRSVAEQARAFSVAGRLDRASRGLLVLTQDGTVARRIIGGYGVEKRYLVQVAQDVAEGQVRRLNGRVALDGVELQPMRVDVVAPRTLRFALVEGRKHQIRRVCRKVGLTVADLLREAVGPFELADLTTGRWRLATDEELRQLASVEVASSRGES